MLASSGSRGEGSGRVEERVFPSGAVTLNVPEHEANVRCRKERYKGERKTRWEG